MKKTHIDDPFAKTTTTEYWVHVIPAGGDFDDESDLYIWDTKADAMCSAKGCEEDGQLVYVERVVATGNDASGILDRKYTTLYESSELANQ